MSKVDYFTFRMFRPMNIAEPFENIHRYLLSKLSHIGAPFGLKGMDFSDLQLPYAEQQIPNVRYTHPDTPKVTQDYEYSHRVDYGRNEDNYFSGVDRILYRFRRNYKQVDFYDVIYTHFPQVIEIFQPRLGEHYYALYSMYYEEGYRPDESPTLGEDGSPISIVPAYNDLRARGITPNGRNNIYTLSPACYWDKDLCQTALGYGRDEVIRRLAGKVPDVHPLADGVYIIFNDNPLLSFDDFLAIQHTFKPILGLQ